MERRGIERPTDESGVSDVDDAVDIEDTGDEDVAIESNPDLEDPRLYSPLLARDDPCLRRRQKESAAAGRSIIPCAREETADDAGEEAVTETPEDET